ncbi:MauE/DoxX family redox-associated membrane protein [Dactylosporangium sp. NPDC051541]|uniref:MauE/DoxX family redox-associated membrane protein n=1 Tax=Dactylosporangium sp. NPDC051541 TaxID=3363977 RepID=UPI0037A8494D
MALTALALVSSTVVSLAGQLLLAGAAVHQLAARRRLSSTLAAHALLPPRLHRVTAAATVAAQLTIGLAGAVTFLAGGLEWIPAAGAAVVYTAFAVYLTALLRVRGPVPCGCLGGDRAGRPAIARAALFAAASIGAALAGPPDLAGGPRLLAFGAAGLLAAFAAQLVAVAEAATSTARR